MGLIFPSEWRFRPPAGSSMNMESISSEAQNDFLALVRKTCSQGDTQTYFEKFKSYFCLANGEPHVWSSSTSWAETDLIYAMEKTANNAPLFIEAFYNACESIRGESATSFAPSIGNINSILQDHDIGYIIEPPNLITVDEIYENVEVPEPPPTLTMRGKDILQASLARSQELLSEGRGREAVQESLWLLETITTAFRGLEIDLGTVEGNYFNTIIKDLKRIRSNSSSVIILDWITKMHGYLSAPTGGGIRHGLDLKDGLVISKNEATLFCNLIRSYLSYLVIEHENLTNGCF